MKYHKKQEIIDAIEFTYTTEGIAALSAFCGSSLLRYGRHRTPREGPWAYIKISETGSEIFVAMEGDMIIKHDTGQFSSLPNSQFHQQYLASESQTQ